MNCFFISSFVLCQFALAKPPFRSDKCGLPTLARVASLDTLPALTSFRLWLPLILPFFNLFNFFNYLKNLQSTSTCHPHRSGQFLGSGSRPCSGFVQYSPLLHHPYLLNLEKKLNKYFKQFQIFLFHHRQFTQIFSQNQVHSFCPSPWPKGPLSASWVKVFSPWLTLAALITSIDNRLQSLTIAQHRDKTISIRL